MVTLKRIFKWRIYTCSKIYERRVVFLLISIDNDIFLLFFFTLTLNFAACLEDPPLDHVMCHVMDAWWNERYFMLLRTMFAYKRSDWSCSWHQHYKLTIELLSFLLFVLRDSKFEIPLYGFNEIEQQSDRCLLFNSWCNHSMLFMRTLSLKWYY